MPPDREREDQRADVAAGASQSAHAERSAVEEALLSLAADVAGYTTLDDLLKGLAARVRAFAPFDRLGLVLYRPETQRLHLALVEPSEARPETAGQLEPPEGFRTDFGPAGWVWESQRSQQFPLSAADPHPTISLLGGLGFRVLCCVPLTTPRARVGVLAFASRDLDGYPDASIAIMARVCGIIALAVEHTMQVERLERVQRTLADERDRARLLLDVSNALGSELELGGLFDAISGLLRDKIPHHFTSLTLWDEELQTLRRHALLFPAGRGLIQDGVPLRTHRSPAWVAFERRETVTFRWHDIEALGDPAVSIMAVEGLHAVCSVPLVTARGCHGTLNVAKREDEDFRADEVELLEQIARQLAIAVENTLAFREIAALTEKLNEEVLYLEDEITHHHDFTGVIGSSRALTTVLTQIRTVAPTDATVLLLGETGTGKEVLARAIHEASNRKGQTFVRVNGAALPAGLVESELFGHEKGAFTGAAAAKVGRLELAHKGTLFLDEVGDIPIDVQPKLLRALQEQEFERLGSTRTQRVDVRLIAATNRNLAEMVEQGAFRRDLFYRLNVFPINVPALRERPDDIPTLVQHFTQRFARDMGKSITTIPAAVMSALQAWHWPGNIRELENLIERAVILSPGPILQVPVDALRPGGKGTRRSQIQPRGHDTSALSPYREHERATILDALRSANGRISGPGGAAARLGLKRTTLHAKMRKLGIQRSSF